ncbi:MAG TPA: tRNA preQ1(34) S-adenosylmethionine ribosyltransferase-isomerase QueA [Thermoanaerobaculia bacterium]|nr:tRNA preQ1(34) S-adenosylmethionine ribosyltransferase-isomerase QueA [Thermoanaerobaculia bacterium]
MKRSDFAYELPRPLIAQEPRPRGRSRMMVVAPREGPPAIEHRTFADFPSQLERGEVVVLNDTRVIPARLYARPKGRMKNPIEFLLVRQRDPMTWETWCRPARRVRPGEAVTFSERLRAEVVEKTEEGSVVIRFLGDVGEIERIGVPPLPPYIERPAPRESDRESYQTVYAAERGAIAAPTAGLHFTRELLEEVTARGVELVRITLHVGLGTFKPVKVEELAEHRMEPERYQISAGAAARLNAALAEGRSLVAVGTTSVRTLESAIRRGEGRFQPGSGETELFITPGFEFRAVNRLLTNFHLPESTLLMLVSAFAGMETIRAVYREAIGRRYLFYSYGDCMFLRNRGAW